MNVLFWFTLVIFSSWSFWGTNTLFCNSIEAFDKDENGDRVTMTYVPVHLYYILFELFKVVFKFVFLKCMRNLLTSTSLDD